MSQDLSVPAGWKLVPVEPTPDQYGAGGVQALKDDMAGTPVREAVGNQYRAMLAAAPTPPIGGDGWLPIEDYDVSEGSVLVFAEGFVGEAQTNCDGDWYWANLDSEYGSVIDPTHFRPLPPPPQPSKEA